MGHSAVTSACLVRATAPNGTDTVTVRVKVAEAQPGDELLVTSRLYQPPVDRNLPTATLYGSGSTAATATTAGPSVDVTIPVAPFSPHPLSTDHEIFVVTDITYCTGTVVEAARLFPDGSVDSTVQVTVPVERVARGDQATVRVVIYQNTPDGDGVRKMLGGGLFGGKVGVGPGWTADGDGALLLDVVADTSYLAHALSEDPLIQQVVEVTAACNTLLQPQGEDSRSAGDGVDNPTWLYPTWLAPLP